MESMLVVGTGLVGTLLAVYLARMGHKVDIYDRNPDMRADYNGKGRAINLTLCDRGFKALDAVGVGDIVRSISVPAYGRFVHGADGQLAYQPYGNNNEALYSILRSELSAALLNFAEREPNIDFHFNEKCTALSLTPLSVEFQNQKTGRTTTRRPDRVFGADGAFSAVRTCMQRISRFNYSQEFLDQGYKELLVPSTADVGWASEKTVLHMWPRGGYMLLGFPNKDGSFTCSLHMPFEGEPSFASLQSESDIVRFFEENFPDVVAHIPRLAESFMQYPANPMLCIRCSPWTFGGKVAMIGDAAHVLYPYYGQGANAGFEDCSVLVDCIGRHGDDWPTVLKEYETLRKPNMDAIADMCVQHYVEIRDSLGDPKFLLRKAIERKVNQMFPDKYTPLYTMIAFTCMPYVEALRKEQKQSLLINEIMKIDGVEEKLESRELEDEIARLMGASALNGH